MEVLLSVTGVLAEILLPLSSHALTTPHRRETFIRCVLSFWDGNGVGVALFLE